MRGEDGEDACCVRRKRAARAPLELEVRGCWGARAREGAGGWGRSEAISTRLASDAATVGDRKAFSGTATGPPVIRVLASARWKLGATLEPTLAPLEIDWPKECRYALARDAPSKIEGRGAFREAWRAGGEEPGHVLLSPLTAAHLLLPRPRSKLCLASRPVELLLLSPPAQAKASISCCGLGLLF